MSPNGRFQPDAFQFEGRVTPDEIAELANDPMIRRVQTSSPADPYTWDLLNNELFSVRPDIQLRVYGFYFDDCDLSFLQRLGHLRRFAAEYLMQATGVEHLSCLPKLESLAVGIYDLESFEFLNSLPCEQITALSLFATRSKRPNLLPVARFKNLKALNIEGHPKGIEVIGGLEHLEAVTLQSLGPMDLQFLQNLSHLWSLDVELGGIRDLSGLDGMSQIKFLELFQIRGLDDISVISRLYGLQFLVLQSLAHIVRLPDFSQLHQLRRVFCEHMNALADLSSLSSATALQEVFFATKHGQAAEEYEWIAKLASVRCATVALPSRKSTERFRELAASHGVGPFWERGKPFDFE